MALTFRNLTVSPDDPVDQWGAEGILAAIDRGGVDDWRRIAHAVRDDPYGKVAADLESALGVAESPGAAALMRRVLDRVRAPESDRVARRVRRAIVRSDLPAARLADEVGTSPSRLSTYASGKVVPSAVMLDRIERAARRSFL